MEPGTKKKITIISVIIAAVAVLAVSGYIYYIKHKKQPVQLTPQQRLVQEQLNALDALKDKFDTPEEVKSIATQQIKSLNELEKKIYSSTTTPPAVFRKNLIQQQLETLKNFKK